MQFSSYSYTYGSANENDLFFSWNFICDLFSLRSKSKLVEIRELTAKFPALKENKNRGSVGKRGSRIVSTAKRCVRRYSRLDGPLVAEARYLGLATGLSLRAAAKLLIGRPRLVFQVKNGAGARLSDHKMLDCPASQDPQARCSGTRFQFGRLQHEAA